MKSNLRFRLSTCTSQLLLASFCAVAAGSPPKPYTPVKASSSEFRCLGRQVKLGQLLLPDQIVAADKPLLAGPIRIVTEPNILSRIKGKSKVLQNNGDKAEWEWSGESPEFRIQVRVTGECDGFCWYEIELSPKQPVKLNAIYFEIPRVADTARYLHVAKLPGSWGGLSKGLAESGGQWSGKFVPYVWLGDEERGLAWCTESDRGWSLNNPRRAVEVKTEGKLVMFRAHLLDHEETISTPLKVRFGLQASPVKPVSFAWRAKARMLHNITYDACLPGTAAALAPDALANAKLPKLSPSERTLYQSQLAASLAAAGKSNGPTLLDSFREAGVKTVIYHDTWTEYFGQVTPSDPQRMRQLIAECHKRSLKLLVYVGYGVARRAPELQGHHDNWSVLPIIPWKPSYRIEFRAFDATCARSGWADWLVQGLDRLFTDYELDGLYMDGTSMAWVCQNQEHGCGWKDSEGKLHAEFPILATRQMMRRIADTVHRHQPEAILDVHMSACMTLPTLSFCDSFYDAEQFENRTRKDKFELPLDSFRTEFMGYAHGLDGQFLCYQNNPFTIEEAIAMAWLHGIEVRPYPETLQPISQVWHAMDQFGTTAAKWLPYWSGSGVTAKEGTVKASVYSKPGKALVFISHLKREPLRAVLSLDRRRLGLAGGSLSATDAIAHTAVPLEGDTLPLSFDGLSYRLIEIRNLH